MYLYTYFDYNTTMMNPSTLMEHVKGNPHIYVSGNFAIMRSLNSAIDTRIMDMVRTPQYVMLGRIVLITAGTATFEINLIGYELKKGDVLVIPQHNYISIPVVSGDFDGVIISFENSSVEIDKCIHFHPAIEDFNRLHTYVDLLWVTTQRPYSIKSLSHLQAALLCDIQQMEAQRQKTNHMIRSRSEELFQRFLDAHQSENLPRSVKSYAEYLCVSPNHLSAVVHKESGRSVMSWLNAHCILRAKVMLLHTNKPIYIIAEELGFQSATFFSRFFHRETGITPTDFRKNQAL